MQDDLSSNVAQSLDGVLTPQNPHAGPNALQGATVVESNRPATQETDFAVIQQRLAINTRWRLIMFGGIILFMIGGGIFTFIQRAGRVAQTQAGSFGAIQLPLSAFASSESTTDTAQTLKVNGQLQVNGSIILTPSSQPTNPVTGQLYFDQTSNRLAYYDGQRFINVANDETATAAGAIGGGTESVGGSNVLLQSTSPGAQQSGSFNISGTGIVGTLKTTIIDSAGSSLFINPSTPVGTITQPAGTPATLGLISGSQTSGGTEDEVLIATEATMPDVGGVATSITVYIVGGSPSGKIQVGLYEDDGDIPNKPATLLAASALQNIVPDSFNTLTIPSTALSANTTYWMAFNTDDPTMKRQYNGGSQISCFITSGFGFMPDPFSPPGCFSSAQHYAIYINYTTTAGGGSGGSFGKSQFSLSPTGQALFQNTENSPTAFQIQTSTGTTLFNIDTANGRVAIGKANAAHKLDIAGGDINLSNNRSIRFGGVQALSSAASGTVTALSNFSSGGTVVVQGDNFVAQDVNGVHNNVLVNSIGAATFSNRVDSATAFQIQNSVGTPLLIANSSAMSISVTGTDINFATLALTDAHFKSTQTTAPTIGTPINCGTGPTAAIAASSTDSAGSFSLTTGTGGTASTCDTVITFRRTYGAAPKSILVVGKTDAASVARQVYVTSAAATTFTVSFATSAGGADSTTYTFNYWVIE